jgi:hypothetical protein
MLDTSLACTQFGHHTEFCVMARSRISLNPGLERIESFGKGSFYTKHGMASICVEHSGQLPQVFVNRIRDDSIAIVFPGRTFNKEEAGGFSLLP